MKSLLASRWLKAAVFLLCAIPAAQLGLAALLDNLGPDPLKSITHFTGNCALIFLLLTLSVTPARRHLRLPDLIRFRRMLGLFAFFYASLHFLTWIGFDKRFQIAEMLGDVRKRPFITVGFTGFALMLPLALTSTSGWVRRLGGQGWHRLHRLVYASATAGVIHYYCLSKSNDSAPLIYAIVLSLLLLDRFRFWIQHRKPLTPNTRFR
jgi:methionine sulfoxide reductase heme-binding subunit